MQYVKALSKWKKQYSTLEGIIEQQKQKINNLQPTKDKTRKFEKLCKDYHVAAVNRKKAAMHSREVQTDGDSRCYRNSAADKENMGKQANVSC